MLFIFYFLIIGIILKVNADLVIDGFNKSLIDEYLKKDVPVKESFNKGASLIFFVSLLIYALIGSFISSIIIANAIWVCFIIANKFKVQERNEFITFKELYTIVSPKELISLIDIPLAVPILALSGVLLIAIIAHFISKKIANKFDFRIPFKIRLNIFIISIIPLTFIFTAPNTYNKYVLKFQEEEGHNFFPVGRAQKAGFIPSFVNTIKPDYMEKPDQYNKNTLLEIEQKYIEIAKEININREKSLNNSLTIYYGSETLIDPMSIPDLIKNETPVPYVSSILDEHIGGTMFSQYIGGGTANIEWTILTSFSLEVFNDPISITPFSDFYAYSKNHHTVLSFFQNDKIAIHPYTAHLYKRKTIYPAIGFV